MSALQGAILNACSRAGVQTLLGSLHRLTQAIGSTATAQFSSVPQGTDGPSRSLPSLPKAFTEILQRQAAESQQQQPQAASTDADRPDVGRRKRGGRKGGPGATAGGAGNDGLSASESTDADDLLSGFQSPHKALNKVLNFQPPDFAKSLDSDYKETVDKYVQRWGPLMSAEMEKAQRDCRDKLETWSDRRLMQEGLMLRKLKITESREVLGKRQIKLSTEGRSLQSHAFTVGSLVTLAQGNPLLFPSLEAIVEEVTSSEIRLGLVDKGIDEFKLNDQNAWRLDSGLGLEVYLRAAKALQSLYRPLEGYTRDQQDAEDDSLSNIEEATAVAQPTTPPTTPAPPATAPTTASEPARKLTKAERRAAALREAAQKAANKERVAAQKSAQLAKMRELEAALNKRNEEAEAIKRTVSKDRPKTKYPPGTVLAPLLVSSDRWAALGAVRKQLPETVMPEAAIAWAESHGGKALRLGRHKGRAVASTTLDAQRAAQIDQSLGLNKSQLAAIANSILNPISVIQGPPGTGKTATIVQFISLLIQQLGYRRGPILACAQSNVVVDNLLQGLCDRGVNALRVGQPYKIRAELRDKTLESEIRKHGPKPVWDKVQVICCTLAGSGAPSLSTRKFPLVILDEAGQATEPECLIPICKGAQHVVLVGDPQQLPPVVMSDKAVKGRLDISMLERLMAQGWPSALLQVQYRMHPGLSRFPSDMFYKGQLVDGVTGGQRPRPHGLPWPTQHAPIMFIDTRGEEENDTNGSFCNQQEADICTRLVRALLRAGKKSSDIGLVALYAAQVRLLDSRIKADQQVMPSLMNAWKMDDSEVEEPELEIKSVDGYQGREKDVIVLSAVRSNDIGRVGFLKDWRRLNVAITRARSGLIIVGNAKTLRSGDTMWAELIQHCEHLGCLVTAEDLRI